MRWRGPTPPLAQTWTPSTTRLRLAVPLPVPGRIKIDPGPACTIGGLPRLDGIAPLQCQVDRVETLEQHGPRLGADLEPVQAAANEATTLQRRLAQEADAKHLAEFKANADLAVNEVDRAAFQTATAPVTEKWSADYGDFVAQLLAAAKT